MEKKKEGRKTILVVDDEAEVRKLVGAMVSRHGYNVLTADSGDHALTLVKNQKNPIDLLLTDVVMPHLGGRSLVAYMAVYFPGIKVLFTSGYAEHGIAHHEQLDQGAAFLAKPFSAAALARKVRGARQLATRQETRR